MYRGRPEFHSTRWRTFWSVALAISVIIATVFYITFYAFSWVSIFFVGFSLLSLLALVESTMNYIQLDENEIRFRKTFRKTNIKRDDIEKIKWEKGSGVSLRLKNGEWVNVPNMGHDSQALSNSLRAWL